MKNLCWTVPLLEESNIPEEKASRIEKTLDETFGDKPPVASNVIDTKAIEQHAIVMEKIELQDQVDVLTQQLEEKTTRLNETTTELTEKSEALDTYESEVKTYDVILRVKPEKASQIHAQEIGGKKCLVIPMDENEHAAINGVNTTI